MFIDEDGKRKERNRMGNVFIIGNGFDLDLGLPTKYSQFADSTYWPVSSSKKQMEMEEAIQYGGSIPPEALGLYNTIENAKNKETWFDLEKELLVFAKVREITRYVESLEDVKNNVDYFNKLRNSLNDYILNVQNNQEISKSCKASDVLNAIVGNGYFENIYSFNYTDLNSIAKQIGITNEIKYTHLHGNVKDRTIILGVDETKLRNGYECFHKSSSRYYRSHDLYNSLITANEIVIFGLSFGKIDYSYFDKYFKSLSEGKSISDDKKQYITIFTKDDGSRLSIITNLRNMGINIQRLYAQSHFQIICTSDDVEKKELSDFYNRLEENSLHVYEEKLRGMAMLVP